MSADLIHLTPATKAAKPRRISVRIVARLSDIYPALEAVKQVMGDADDITIQLNVLPG